MVYELTIPIFTEYQSEFDSFSAVTKQEVSINYSFELKQLGFSIEYEEGKGKVRIENIQAENGLEAYIIAKSWMDRIMEIMSLYSQKVNYNQHLGHLRFKWSKNNIEILPKDNYTMASMESTMTSKVNLDNIEKMLEKLITSPKTRFISNAYYGALQSLDYRAKYYHAFTIIEFLENLHKEDVGAKKYKKEHCRSIGAGVNKSLIELGYSNEDSEYAKSAILGALNRITVENRQQKLHYILSKIYKIEQVRYLEEVEISESLIKQLIENRNKLFHGIETSDNKRLADILILICEKIYWHWLKNEE